MIGLANRRRQSTPHGGLNLEPPLRGSAQHVRSTKQTDVRSPTQPVRCPAIQRSASVTKQGEAALPRVAQLAHAAIWCDNPECVLHVPDPVWGAIAAHFGPRQRELRRQPSRELAPALPQLRCPTPHSRGSQRRSSQKRRSQGLRCPSPQREEGRARCSRPYRRSRQLQR